MGVHRAQTYYERFETLVNDIRGLGYPDLKFFSVAVTGSIPSRLPFLQQVGWAFVLTLFVLPSFANPPPDALSVMAAVAQPRDVDCTETRLFGAPFCPTRFAMCSSGQALQRGSPACGSRMHSVCPCPRTVCICSPTHRYVCMHTPCLILLEHLDARSIRSNLFRLASWVHSCASGNKACVEILASWAEGPGPAPEVPPS